MPLNFPKLWLRIKLSEKYIFIIWMPKYISLITHYIALSPYEVLPLLVNSMNISSLVLILSSRVCSNSNSASKIPFQYSAPHSTHSFKAYFFLPAFLSFSKWQLCSSICLDQKQWTASWLLALLNLLKTYFLFCYPPTLGHHVIKPHSGVQVFSREKEVFIWDFNIEDVFFT